ncbi:NADH dehydrogenase (ubiquinone) complex I, assembly factor 6 isoform X2 [Prorops nasuta]|uniref:NADH dehydrogenase (ubiquinone) complex I, assembly factor 6 isoform X2 n=1 Tax=Prorops nasuta TaxID=863751 RepID=UPI0034CEA42E
MPVPFPTYSYHQNMIYQYSFIMNMNIMNKHCVLQAYKTLMNCRKKDYENFLCSLLLPERILAAGFAIRAFNVEIAQIPDQITNDTLGAMRFQFWKDALNKIYDGSPPSSPVAVELYRILRKHKLSKYYFQRLIDARLQKLNDLNILPDMRAIENYAEQTVSSIYYLLLEAAEITNVNADHIASHLGKAHGITNLIRSIPYNCLRREICLPQDILLKHGVSSEAVLQGKFNKSLSDVIFDVASNAKLHLDKVHLLMKKSNSDLVLIFLPMVCIESYLNKLQQYDFNVYYPKVQSKDPFLMLKLLKAKYFS